jgi:hypothetical protein
MTYALANETASQSQPQTFSSGQTEPILELLRPYSAFPKTITGPTVWKREDFINDTSLWKHTWTAEHIKELEAAYEAFLSSGLELPEINQVRYLLSARVILTDL